MTKPDNPAAEPAGWEAEFEALITTYGDLENDLGFAVIYGDDLGPMRDAAKAARAALRAWVRARLAERPEPIGSGLALIAAERRRQVEEEGWTSEHDARYTGDDLARAAAIYAMDPAMRAGISAERDETMGRPPAYWPWSKRWWKPTPDDRVMELVKAGALIAAEIDRVVALHPVTGGGE